MKTFPLKVADAFTAAVTTTLQELAGIEALPASATNDAGPALSGPVVVATIQLLRDPPGSMSLVLASDTVAILASRYLPTGTVLSFEIIDDVAGEFANVIAGQAKTMLKGTPYHFLLSTPEVKRASSFRPDLTTRPTLAMCLSTEIGIAVLLADLTDGKTGSAVHSPQEQDD